MSSLSEKPKRRHKKKKGKKKKQLSTIGVQTQSMTDTGVQTNFSSPRSTNSYNANLGSRKLKIIPDEDEAPPLPPPPRSYSSIIGLDPQQLYPSGGKACLP